MRNVKISTPLVSDHPELSHGGLETMPLTAKISRRIPKSDGTTQLRLDNGEEQTVHRFALISVGDKLRYCNKKLEVIPARMNDDASLPLHPVWKKNHRITVCGKRLEIVVKEIETASEFAGYEALVQHHYRNRAGAARRAPLIATVCSDDLPEVVGFVEISSCFLVNVPRKHILNQQFSDPERDIAWEHWDIDSAKKYTNAIARISRCVVYPELRGVGAAGILANSAVEFAQQRWHIGGLRPCFLEIAAEMLRYWPFVKKAGFVKIGETEGNTRRLKQTMAYLLKRNEDKRGMPQGGGGILSMHRSHAAKLEQIREERGWSVERVIELVANKPKDLKVDDWIELHSIYRRPKPVYMLGLTKAAKKHLRRHCPRESTSSSMPSHRPIVIRGMNIRTVCKPDGSQDARRIQEAFGIVTKNLETNLIVDLDWELKPGEIALVTGASGSGKSLLLNTLARYASKPKSKQRKTARVISSVDTPSSYSAKAVALAPPPPKKSPIALLRKHKLSLEESMRILATAGLGEAQIFVRPSEALSSGQRYRLALAIALAQKPSLLLIDEFCESLDNYSTAALCSRLYKEANRCGFAVVVATANSDRVRKPLRPHKILRLLPNGQHHWEKQP